MTHLKYLIQKHGRPVDVNGRATKLFTKENKHGIASLMSEFEEVTTTSTMSALLPIAVSPNDRVTIGDKKFRVLNSTDVMYKDRLVYTMCYLYEDDFSHSVKLIKCRLREGTINIPEKVEVLIEAQARIQQRAPEDTKRTIYDGGAVMSHVVSFVWEEDLSSIIFGQDIMPYILCESDLGEFRVLEGINVGSKDVLIDLYCEEVYDVEEN